MCGIAGSATAGAPREAEIVAAITASQRDRGPDAAGQGEWSANGLGVVLGHARLSIIDLSEDASQPMTGREDRFSIVFNGEIYNYLELRDELRALGATFRTQSDTEVILEAWRRWGPETPARLFGMFAFALFDSATGRLWLVRDRFGVKPLYYAEHRGVLWFGSTARVIAQRLGLPPDLEYVARGLAYGVYEDDSGAAPYAGVRALPPGHLLQVDAVGGSLRTREARWYDPLTRVEALREQYAGRTLESLAEEAMALLADAVRIRFRADVPVGLALSGGLDSSAIASFAREFGSDLRGVTYGEPTEPESEGPMVALLAQRYGLRMHYAPSRAETLAGAFRATVEAQDAPFTSGSIIAQYLVFGLAHKVGLKVLLGGQGSDEAFMGYRHFHTHYVRQLAAGGHPIRALRHLMGWLPSLSGAQLRGILSRGSRSSQPRGVIAALPGLPSPAKLDLGLGGGPLWRRALLDVTRFSLPTLLRYEDRNSMAHSVESRHPFMDHRLIELGLSLTDEQRLAHGRGKWILRVGLAGRIPEEIRMSRQKLGFPANQEAAVAAGLGRVIREALVEVSPVVTTLLGAGVPIEERFSDGRLATEPARMAEAATLYWLGLRG